MGEESGTLVSRAADVDPEELADHDIIGFGSGVYNGRLHKELAELLDKAGEQAGKKAFIFSTTGSSTYSAMAHERFKPLLEKKGFKLIGEFSCPGFDTALTSEGINKGRPDQRDTKDAREFIRKISV
jgi:flavodoxin